MTNNDDDENDAPAIRIIFRDPITGVELPFQDYSPFQHLPRVGEKVKYITTDNKITQGIVRDIEWLIEAAENRYTITIKLDV